MKKIILAVILVAAVGGAAYYLLQNKNQNAVSSFKQEEIIGKWTLVRWTPFGDSLARSKDTVAYFPINADSNRSKYDYDFKKENIVLISLNDSVLSDTARYQWTKDNHIEWKKQNDSAEILTVTTLNKDSLVLKTNDSAVIYFKRVK